MMEAQMAIILLWAKVNAFDRKAPCGDCDSLKKENTPLRLEIESLRSQLGQVSNTVDVITTTWCSHKDLWSRRNHKQTLKIKLKNNDNHTEKDFIR